jgi:SAM-dependent methyltransferase
MTLAVSRSSEPETLTDPHVAVTRRRSLSRTSAAFWLCVLAPALATAQAAAQKPFEPTVGQAGKDVVWVPTPAELVEKMLDMAAVTPQDFVMDLGSGDGRNIIAAAKRGARAVGVEYNPDMVALSRKRAQEAGVADKATFIEGDMFTADISKANVLALFLLPDNLDKLRDKFLALRPGSRIVLNTFGIHEWDPDVTEKIEGDCASWCTAMLYIVPAQVAGRWTVPQGQLVLSQKFQIVTGNLTIGGKTTPIMNGKLRGDQFTFTADGTEYSGNVNGNRIEGTRIVNGKKEAWAAAKAP